MRRERTLGARIAAPWLNAALMLALLPALLTAPARAQIGGGGSAAKVVRVKTSPVTLPAGGKAEAVVTLDIDPGWHINSNPASPDYMIATEVELDGGYEIVQGKAIYPPAKKLKVGFDESPLSVYGGDAVVRLPLAAGVGAVNGSHRLKGKVRFQACNDQVCMTPTSVPFELEVVVTGGSDVAPGTSGTPRTKPIKGSAPATIEAPNAGATPHTEGRSPEVSPTPQPSSPPPASEAPGGTPEASISDARHEVRQARVVGFLSPKSFLERMKLATGGASAGFDLPFASALDRGGWKAFLTLFGLGLALNLTPCVYPMLGVTVSIFGARRSVPPLQVFGLASVYVLGMAVMYTSLGMAAAFTGGLFGGLLQNPIVQVGIGVLFVALALSMFGLYELQPPPQLLSKLGGASATSLAGTFLSGLVVGVFAAPCIGPPVVALLAIVGAKGDPWFGFRTFFILAMGLGAPYLVLGTFSNLIQRLPRSGEWMVWVKHLFGIALLALGLFYASLALAPQWSFWVGPLALILGGVVLGFFDRNADRVPAFFWAKRVGGGLALIAGTVMIATAPKEGIVFEPFSADAMHAALESGRPVMLDFTANWCAPCHELERFTFTDSKVRQEAKRFRAFRVDLTSYHSPESERWRRHYGITGVPTVIFLAPAGVAESGRTTVE